MIVKEARELKNIKLDEEMECLMGSLKDMENKEGGFVSLTRGFF